MFVLILGHAEQRLVVECLGSLPYRSAVCSRKAWPIVFNWKVELSHTISERVVGYSNSFFEVPMSRWPPRHPISRSLRWSLEGGLSQRDLDSYSPCRSIVARHRS